MHSFCASEATRVLVTTFLSWADAAAESEIAAQTTTHRTAIAMRDLQGTASPRGYYTTRIGAHPGRFHSTSNKPAAPIPPPMHIVTTTCLTPRRLPSMSAWPVRRAPEAP